MVTTAKTPPTPLPSKVRRGLIAGATLLVLTAAAGNIGHTYEHADRLGQPGVMGAIIAVLPDVMLVLTILRLRYHHRSLWAWTGVAASTGFVGWASIATSTHELGGKIVAVAPLLAAVIAAGLLEGGPSGETLEAFVARTDNAVRDAREAARQAHEDAERRLAETAQEAARLVREANEAAQLEADRAGALALELTGAQAALAAAHEAARATASQPRTPGARKRTAGTRKQPARATHGDSDLQRRAAVREEFTASVRSGAPLTNERLASLLYGVDAPDSRQVASARARASEWRRAAEADPRTDDADENAEAAR